MTVCAHRTDSPGFFTSCVAATGRCRCGEDVMADQIQQTQPDTETLEETR